MAAKPQNSARLHEWVPVDGALAALCFALALLLYIRTLAPSLLLGDSAEFQTLSFTLGMTHVTGYAVYLLLSRVFIAVVPAGDIAYRVNLFSAFTGALAASLLYLLGRTLAGWRIPALAAAGVLVVNKTFWWHAVIAERMTAAAALIGAVLLFLLLWRQSGKLRYLFAAGLLGGLSLGVHNTVALVAPAVLVYLFVTFRHRGEWIVSLCGALLGTGLALGAFFLVDAINPPSNYYDAVFRPSISLWNMTSAALATPLQRLGFMLSAGQFRQYMFNQPLNMLSAPASNYWQFFADSTPGNPVLEGLLMGLGFLAPIMRRWREGLLVLLAWLSMMAFILNYAIIDVFSFYVPTYILVLLAVCAGISALLDGAVWLVNHLGAGRWSPLAGNAVGLAVVIFLTWPAGYVIQAVQAGRIEFLNTIPTAYPADVYPYPLNQPDAPAEQARAIIGKLEDNAIVFTDWPTLYTLYYVAQVEQDRIGMSFHETNPQEGVTDLADSAVAYIDANLTERPIYVVNASHGVFLKYYRLIPIAPGFYRLAPKP